MQTVKISLVIMRQLSYDVSQLTVIVEPLIPDYNYRTTNT